MMSAAGQASHAPNGLVETLNKKIKKEHEALKRNLQPNTVKFNGVSKKQKTRLVSGSSELFWFLLNLFTAPGEGLELFSKPSSERVFFTLCQNLYT